MTDFIRIEPWIGVDLDATLAEYHRFEGIDHIGKPIDLTVQNIKRQILGRGIKCKIFTARYQDQQNKSKEEVAALIQKWLKERCDLPPFEVTDRKDFGMIEIWDDRAAAISPNHGTLFRWRDMP